MRARQLRHRGGSWRGTRRLAPSLRACWRSLQLSSVISAILLELHPSAAIAQTASFYLHNESSTNPLYFALKTAGPDAPAVVLQSLDLKKLPPGKEGGC